jgi:hypothetical protein
MNDLPDVYNITCNTVNMRKLKAGIVGFDAGQLKHTETQEKNVLPDPSGN